MFSDHILLGTVHLLFAQYSAAEFIQNGAILLQPAIYSVVCVYIHIIAASLEIEELMSNDIERN